MKFKKGDLVCIPTKSRLTNSPIKHLIGELSNINYTLPYLRIYLNINEDNIGLEGANGEHFSSNSFHEDDLELYVEPKKGFSVGDKVVPHKKSVYSSLATATEWNKAKKNGQPFLYVQYTYPDGDVACTFLETGSSSDLYRPEDLSIYVEPIISREFQIGDVVELVEDYETIPLDNKDEPNCARHWVKELKGKGPYTVTGLNGKGNGRTLYFEGNHYNFNAKLFKLVKTNKMSDKKIIGFKLKAGFNKYSLNEARYSIRYWGTNSKDWDIQVDSGAHKNAIADGILDVMFTTVYEDEKIIFGRYIATVEKEVDGSNVIAFGCQKFSLTQLQTIKKLLGSEIGAEITVKRVPLTESLIDKLIKKLP